MLLSLPPSLLYRHSRLSWWRRRVWVRRNAFRRWPPKIVVCEHLPFWSCLALAISQFSQVFGVRAIWSQHRWPKGPPESSSARWEQHAASDLGLPRSPPWRRWNAGAFWTFFSLLSPKRPKCSTQPASELIVAFLSPISRLGTLLSS